MTTPKESFASQLKFLSENGYNVLSCDDAVDRVIANDDMPPNSISITLDDGFKDNLTNCLPILEKYGFKATIFLAVGYIGKGGEYLNWDDIKFLSKTGLVSFGAHSLSHRRLSGLGQEDLMRELIISKKMLEDNLKTKIDLFAYPFGSYGSFDSRTESVLKSSGYKAAFTTIAGCNTQRTNLFRLRRTRISWYDDEREFKKELTGGYDWYSIWQMVERTV
jgi:peptidoglycan/xylan/chitin deacetylase (PgdA/CDA1 family)